MTKRHTNGQFARQPELSGVKLLSITILFALTAWIYGNIKAMPAEAVSLVSPQGDTLVQIEGEGEASASPAPLTVEEKVLWAWGKVEGPRALKLLKECENKDLNPKAINHNRNGSTDHGLFQINSIHGYSQSYLEDVDNNIEVAYKIYQDRGWEAWSCAWVLNETPFYAK